MGTKRKVTCKHFLEQVSDYIDGALEPDLRVTLEAHLGKCTDCWVEFDDTRKTVEIVQHTDCHPLPQDVHDRLLKTLESQWEQAKR
jgi:anti-sigma factor RsiW